MPIFLPSLRLLAATIAIAAPAAAQDYPSRAVKIVVSAPPGGGVDIVARVIADRLAKLWGQPFVVENRPGAGGNLGAEAVAQAEPDGYTLLASQPAPLTTNVVLYRRLNFDPAAFEPLAIMTSIPNTLVVRPDFPASSVAELIAHAKANPGKVNFGSQGVGTTPHLTGELFARLTGTTLTHVPYRGTAQAVNDLVAGHVDLLFFQIDAVRAHYQAGKAKMLAVTTAGRVAAAAGGPDHGRGRRRGTALRHLERAGGTATHPGGGDRQAQRGDQRHPQAPGNRRAFPLHEHDTGRRHAGGDQEVPGGGDGALGRGDPRRQHQRELKRQARLARFFHSLVAPHAATAASTSEISTL